MGNIANDLFDEFLDNIYEGKVFKMYDKEWILAYIVNEDLVLAAPNEERNTMPWNLYMMSAPDKKDFINNIEEKQEEKSFPIDEFKKSKKAVNKKKQALQKISRTKNEED